MYGVFSIPAFKRIGCSRSGFLGFPGFGEGLGNCQEVRWVRGLYDLCMFCWSRIFGFEALITCIEFRGGRGVGVWVVSLILGSLIFMWVP